MLIMLEEDLLYALALQRTKGIGDINAKKLISHCGSAKKVLNEKRHIIEKINGIGYNTVKHLFDKNNLVNDGPLILLIFLKFLIERNLEIVEPSMKFKQLFDPTAL